MGEKTVSLRVQASDLNSGKVMQIAFYEFSHNQSKNLLYDIITPKAVVDTIIPYTIYAEEHEKATLTFWAIDVAGQISEQVSISLFWWDSQGVVCFPNPFNPNVGEIAIIQSDVPDVANARILDPFGRLIRSLNKSELSDFFEWDGRNGQGDLVSRGGYIFVIDGHKDLYCKIAVIK